MGQCKFCKREGDELCKHCDKCKRCHEEAGAYRNTKGGTIRTGDAEIVHCSCSYLHCIKGSSYVETTFEPRGKQMSTESVTTTVQATIDYVVLHGGVQNVTTDVATGKETRRVITAPNVLYVYQGEDLQAKVTELFNALSLPPGKVAEITVFGKNQLLNVTIPVSIVLVSPQTPEPSSAPVTE